MLLRDRRFVECFLRPLDNIGNELGNELGFDPLDLQFHPVLSRIPQQGSHPGNALTVNINRQKSICRRLR
jgi:hypothetical protein